MNSIEWLVEQLWNYSEPSLTNKILIDKAKEMHKQEIIDAFKSGLKSPYHQDYTFVTQDNQEGTKSAQYYQETFVSKGSDEVELPQQEISDEEIEKAAWEYVYNHKINGHNIVHWINAIKWYREQLKSK